MVRRRHHKKGVCYILVGLSYSVYSNMINDIENDFKSINYELHVIKLIIMIITINKIIQFK